ncbi:MAG: SlyX family protein [Candidatus Sericytochromatia bacterium]
MWEDRLIELETRLAFQDDELLKLKALSASQQKQVYRLEATLEHLLLRFKALQENAGSEKIPNEKPPHY